MKKILIGILIIIPIIIVAVVAGVSVVVSMTSYIGVESVSLDKNVLELAFGNVYYDLSDYLSVDVLPEKATNPTYSWRVENVNCWDKDYLDAWNNYVNGAIEEEVLPPVSLVDEDGAPVDSNSSGKIMVNSYCSFVLVAEAETMSARCNVIISGAGLESVIIKGKDSLKVGQSTMLTYDRYPLDGLVRGEQWSSSNESVVKVDKNGVITGVGKGSATITLRADKGQDQWAESSFVVNVEGNVSSYGNKVYVSQNTFNLSSIGVDSTKVLTADGCTIAGDQITLTAEVATLTFAEGTLVINKCLADEIKIDNAQFFDYELTEGSYVLVSGKSICLEASHLSVLESGDVDATWSVDNESIATIDQNGVLTGIAEGVVEVRATAGDKVAIIKINVHKKVTTLVVDRTARQLSPVGIAREYVMASERYEEVDGTLQKAPNFFDFSILRPLVPEDEEERKAFYDAFIFMVTENGAPSDKAYFEGNRMIFVPGRIEGKTTLTVTVKAKRPMYESLAYLTTAEIQVHVANAVAVGNYAELLKACNDHENVTLYDDIMLFDGDPQPTNTVLFCYGSYYGNAHILSAQRGQLAKHNDLIAFCASNVVISNATFRANELGDDVVITSEGEGALEACSLNVYAFNPIDWYSEEGRLTNVLIEYCIIENGKSLLDVYGADVTMRGCIARNSSGAGLLVDTYHESFGLMYSHFTMENCVMSNLLGMALSFPYYHYDRNGVDDAMRLISEGKNTCFNQRGFLDIYNWQPTNTMGLIPRGTIGEGMEFLEDGINSMLREEFTKDALAPYRFTYNSVDHFLLGGMSIGLLHKSYLEGYFEDPRLTTFNSTIIENALLKSFKDTPVNVITYKNDVTDITPGASYVINDRLIRKLHGEGIERRDPVPFSFV